MVLGYKSIKKLIQKNILIENANNQNIHSSSYDVTVDKYILKFKSTNKPISLIDAQELSEMYEEVNISEGYILKPGETILVVLEDVFNLPNNVCGSIRGRTSFNRLGLTIPVQHLNPGFKGKLNITLTNHSTNSYMLMPKLQIAQVIFERMDKKVSKKHWYPSEEKASYQQKDGLQGSMIYNDFVGKVVRHFKGNYYYIVDICMDTETNEHTVIYRSLYDNDTSKTWSRPAKMFFEKIDPNKEGNVTKQSHRFEIVTDLAKDYTKKPE